MAEGRRNASREWARDRRGAEPEGGSGMYLASTRAILRTVLLYLGLGSLQGPDWRPLCQLTMMLMTDAC
jgi:hypothetical protein